MRCELDRRGDATHRCSALHVGEELADAEAAGRVHAVDHRIPDDLARQYRLNECDASDGTRNADDRTSAIGRLAVMSCIRPLADRANSASVAANDPLICAQTQHLRARTWRAAHRVHRPGSSLATGGVRNGEAHVPPPDIQADDRAARAVADQDTSQVCERDGHVAQDGRLPGIVERVGQSVSATSGLEAQSKIGVPDPFSCLRCNVAVQAAVQGFPSAHPCPWTSSFRSPPHPFCPAMRSRYTVTLP